MLYIFTGIWYLSFISKPNRNTIKI